MASNELECLMTGARNTNTQRTFDEEASLKAFAERREREINLKCGMKQISSQK